MREAMKGHQTLKEILHKLQEKETYSGYMLLYLWVPRRTPFTEENLTTTRRKNFHRKPTRTKIKTTLLHQKAKERQRIELRINQDQLTLN